jgi:hypothetical protein
MSTTDDYRRFAAECLEMSKGTSDPTARSLFLHMAQAWARLAEGVVPTVAQPHQAHSSPKNE